MDGLKTIRPTGSADPTSFEMKRTTKESNIPQRPSSSGKLLQLTPLWEHVIKYQRLPPDLHLEALFEELGTRLRDLEWEVTQHAVRFLVDLIPVVGDVLDTFMLPNILNDLINNLGHSAPAVRKGALDALRTYLRYSHEPEMVLSAIITKGLDTQASPKSLQSNVAIGVILSSPSLIFPLIKSKSETSVTQDVLVQLVSALSKKLVQVTYQEAALKALVNIRDMVGESKFDRFLDGFHTECKKDFDLLCNVYEVGKKSDLEDSGIDMQLISQKYESGNTLESGYRGGWSDDSPPMHDSSGPASDNSFTYQNTHSNEVPTAKPRAFSRRDGNSLDGSQENRDSDVNGEGENSESADGSDLERDELINGEVAERKGSSQLDNEETLDFKSGDDDDDDDDDDDVLQPNRVVLETEIKFSEETAITMTILEEKMFKQFANKKIEEENEEKEVEFVGNSMFNNTFVMKVLADEDFDYDMPVTRTPRRVRFGGEMVMMRTPDSDVLSDYALEEPKHGGPGDSSSLSLSLDTSPSEGADSCQVEGCKPDSISQVETDLTDRGTFDSNRNARDESPPTMSHNFPSQIPLPIHPALNKPRESWKKGPVFYKSPYNANSESVVIDEKRLEKSGSDSPIPTFDGGESLASSSDGEQLYKIIDGNRLANEPEKVVRTERLQESSSWEDFNLVDQKTVTDLQDKDDWRARSRGLERLRISLQQSAVIERVTKCVPSLLHLLLTSLASDPSHRIDAAALKTVRELVKVLPVNVLRSNLQQLVVGICRHIANTGSVSGSIEAVQTAKTIMQIVSPTPVIDVLVTRKCLGAKSSKMRENALVFILYTTMTFPSTEFACERLAKCVLATAANDVRRRVRLASLETLAALGQLTGTKWLLDAANEVLDSPRPEFLAAIKTRLARRQLPNVAPDSGLLLYALQIPLASQSSGAARSHEGADVEWILQGTGSISSGSARSRNQLNNAQRISPPVSFGSVDFSDADSHLQVKARNPWTDRRPQDIQAVGMGVRGTNPPTTSAWAKNTNKNQVDTQRSWESSLWEGDINARQGVDATSGLRRVMSYQAREAQSSRGRLKMPPLVTKYEQAGMEKEPLVIRDSINEHIIHQPGTEKSASSKPNNLNMRKSDRTKDNGTALVVGRDVPAITNKSSSEMTSLDEHRSAYRRRSIAPARGQRQEDLQKITFEDLQMKQRPPFFHQQLSPTKRSLSNITSSQLMDPEQNKNTIPQKPLLARYDNALPRLVPEMSRSEPVLFPASSEIDQPLESKPARDNMHPPSKPQLHKLGSHTVSSPAVLKHPENVSFGPVKKMLAGDNLPTPGSELEKVLGVQTAGKDLELPIARTQVDVVPPLHRTVAPKPKPSVPKPVIAKGKKLKPAGVPIADELKKEADDSLMDAELNEEDVDDVVTAIHSTPPIAAKKSVSLVKNDAEQPQIQPKQVLEESVSIDLPTVTESQLEELDINKSSPDSDNAELPTKPLEVHNEISTEGARPKRSSLVSNSSQKSRAGLPEKTGGNQQRIVLYPDTLTAMDNPKEGLQLCLSQLDHSDWEMTMRGLTTLVRLTRFHATVLLGPSLHTVVVALVKQVQNLRSQIARAACQVSGELFTALKKALDAELEELAGALLHRSADTNRFLRADSNAALDVMLDNCTPMKTVQVVVLKGASHKNAIVRSVAARLLLSLTTKLGAEKVLASPKDMRDKILFTGANLLTEGSLETRKYAKELFRTLSSKPNFYAALSEAVPASTLRNIKKILQTLN